MDGKVLKEKLRSEGFNFSELAKELGYSCDQNLHSVLGAKDVRSGLIESLSMATGKPIAWFYGDGNAVSGDNGISVSGDNNNIATISERFISLLEKKDEQIDKLLSLINKK